MRNLILGILLLLPAAANAADSWRTFTDNAGRKLEAAIVRVEDSYAILKLKASGKEATVGFNRLSDEDIDFLQGWKPSDPPEDSGQTKETTGKAKEDAGEEGEAGEPDVGRLYPRSKEEIRSTIREIGNRPRPEGISKEVHEATEQLNIFRYLCGVPHDVEPDAEFSANAEDAAKACEKNGGLSHALGHSTNKCNLAGGSNMVASVGQYIADSGDNNREARGHRAWCLNPPMKRVGFGGSGSYSAMWCMNSEGKSIRDSWTYPGKGLFPLEYMRGNAWSLYGAGVPDSADKVKVRVFRLSKRPDKPLSATGEIPGREIPVNYVSKAMMNGINFEPEEPAKRGIYWVDVRGGGIRESYLVELY